MMRYIKKRLFLFITLSLLILPLLSAPAFSLDDDEYGGYSADTLTIKVGYFGGHTMKKRFSRWTSSGLWMSYMPTTPL
jgi:hypothetical protein